MSTQQTKPDLSSIALSVNVNKIALIRNSREGDNPNLTAIADDILDYGAQGITVHPRSDQRHIRPEDCTQLAALIKNRKTKKPTLEFNIEGNPFAVATHTPRTDFSDYPGFLAIVEQCRPDQVTLVPDGDSQLTSDHGFDLSGDTASLTEIIEHLHSLECRISLFMDADIAQISRAAEIGADCIELYTGPFAQAFSQNPEAGKKIFNHHCNAAEHAAKLGLGINAGHDLNLENLVRYRQLPHLKEVSIGHAFTIDSLHHGLKSTTEKYLALLAT